MLNFSPKPVGRKMSPGLNTLTNWTTGSALRTTAIAPLSIHIFSSTTASLKSIQRIEMLPKISLSNPSPRKINPNVQPYQLKIKKISNFTTPRAIFEHYTLKTTIHQTSINLIPSQASNKGLNSYYSSMNYSIID